MAQGAWLMAKTKLALGPGLGGPTAKFFLSHEPRVMSFRPKTGSNRAQNTANKLAVLLLFYCFLMYLKRLVWVLNYSKIAIVVSRAYCNMFWDIFGTTKNVAKSGPSYPHVDHQNTSKDTSKLWEHP